MAVRAEDITLRDLGDNCLECSGVLRHPGYFEVFLCWVAVVKLEDANVRLPTSHAGGHTQILDDVLSPCRHEQPCSTVLLPDLSVAASLVRHFLLLAPARPALFPKPADSVCHVLVVLGPGLLHLTFLAHDRLGHREHSCRVPRCVEPAAINSLRARPPSVATSCGSAGLRACWSRQHARSPTSPCPRPNPSPQKQRSARTPLRPGLHLARYLLSDDVPFRYELPESLRRRACPPPLPGSPGRPMPEPAPDAPRDPAVKGDIRPVVPLPPSAVDALLDPQTDPPVSALYPLDLFVPTTTLIGLVEESMANLRAAPPGGVTPAATERARAALLAQRATFLAWLRGQLRAGELSVYCSLYPVDDAELLAGDDGGDDPTALGDIDPEIGF